MENISKCSFRKHLWVQQGCWRSRFFLTAHAEKKESPINHSALFCCIQRRVITCGTHFEETKLVASITDRPVPESMSISWIFTPVGTISWGTMKLKQHFLDLIPPTMGGKTCRYMVDFVLAMLPANHITIYTYMPYILHLLNSLRFCKIYISHSYMLW